MSGFFIFPRLCYFKFMETKTPFYFFTFPNGLRLITVPVTSTDSVTVLVMVGTGSRYENKEINGISHFLEHMMFKGTAKRPKVTDIALELDTIGAEYNAFTGKEYTGYYVKCAAEKVDTALDVISDIFQNSKLDAEEMERERGVIIEEINMYLDTPARYVGDLFEELMYGDQPLGWHITGPKENVDKLQRGQFVDYFNTHYVAQNLTHEKDARLIAAAPELLAIVAALASDDPLAACIKTDGTFVSLPRQARALLAKIERKEIEA